MEHEVFLNRETELHLIEAALQALRERRPRERLIELYGLVGIGKTALLRQIQRRCLAQSLPVLWVDLGPEAGPEALVSQLLLQLPQQEPPSQPPGSSASLSPVPEEHSPAERDNAAQPAQLIIQGLRALLARHDLVVLLLDAVEVGDKRLMHLVASLLGKLGPEAPLLIVLTALHPLPFEEEQVIMGGLRAIELGELDRPACEAYLAAHGLVLSAEEHAWLWRWAGGYPLALEVLNEALRAGLLPRQPNKQRQLCQLLNERVIRQRVLTLLPLEERATTETLLRLLAVPRRFTALLLQELIEQFSPSLAQKTPLSYFFLLRALSARTNALRWSPERAGYAIEAPLRRLLLLSWHMEEPERLLELHRWLATFNRRQAGNMTGTDRLRSLREWLYHRTLGLEPAAISQMTRDLLVALRQEPAELRAQFSEDLRQDQDLQEALGVHAAPLLLGLQALEHND
ncbi:AAA family ATPase [Thermogemmatispora sp.]|uniref:AAA family ATPase n=1 Tax=Thermogemmatispora sp. TaxID=1968838 RepID=UPI0035E456F4